MANGFTRDSTGHLQPQPQPSPKVTSPAGSSIPDISPIAPSSNGTDTTDIDDTTIEDDGHAEATPPVRNNERTIHELVANNNHDSTEPSLKVLQCST